MSNEAPVLKNLTKNATDVPRGPGGSVGDAYVTLLVLLCVFVAAMLVLLSVLLVFCRRCYRGGRRYSRASNDPEKSNTTYLEECPPVPEIRIQGQESDRRWVGSEQDVETERFLSTGSTGRRVSFNESALLDHGKRAQERGRRYTLTEGDFHHLKNARLTHLHLPPPAVQILTIEEYDAATDHAPKHRLSIFQPSLCPSLPRTALAGLSPNSALPGDALNSVLDPAHAPGPARSCTIEVMGRRTWSGASPGPGGGDGLAETGPGSVLHFLAKLRRHSSLEGPSPRCALKQWKIDSSQRATSLDTRGSPKRHQFQRQRAANESTPQQEGEEPEEMELSVTLPKDEIHPPRLLTPPPTSPPPSSRLDPEAAVDSSSADGAVAPSPSTPRPQEEDEEDEEEEPGAGPGPGAAFRQDSAEHQALYRDIWTLRASLEQYASSDQSSNNDRESVRSDADSVCSLGGAWRAGLSSCPSQDIGDEEEEEEEEEEEAGADPDRGGGGDGDSGNRKLLQMDSGYASIEAPPRGAGGGAGGGARGKTASEKRHFFTSAGRKGSVCESQEARLFQEELEDLAAVAREEEEEEGRSAAGWPPYGQAFPAIPAKEAKPRLQALRRRDYSIDEKTDALFSEFLRHDPRFDQQQSPRPRPRPPSRVHLRAQWQRAKQHSDPGVGGAYALAPRGPPMRRGDSANFPLDTRYHGTLPRIVSAADEEAEGPGAGPGEGGVRAGPGEGGVDADVIGLDSRKDRPRAETIGGGAREGVVRAEHSREGGAREGVVRAEHSREGGASTAATPPTEAQKAELEEERRVSPSASSSSSSGTVKEGDSTSSPPPSEPPPAPPGTGYGPQTVTEGLADKLARGLEDRLYTGLGQPVRGAERMVRFTHVSPDHSPV